MKAQTDLCLGPRIALLYVATFAEVNRAPLGTQCFANDAAVVSPAAWPLLVANSEAHRNKPPGVWVVAMCGEGRVTLQEGSVHSVWLLGTMEDVGRLRSSFRAVLILLPQSSYGVWLQTAGSRMNWTWGLSPWRRAGIGQSCTCASWWLCKLWR